MVDGIGLENRRTRKGIGGSNPSLSAIPLPQMSTPFLEFGGGYDPKDVKAFFTPGKSITAS